MALKGSLSAFGATFPNVYVRIVDIQGGKQRGQWIGSLAAFADGGEAAQQLSAAVASWPDAQAAANAATEALQANPTDPDLSGASATASARLAQLQRQIEALSEAVKPTVLPVYILPQTQVTAPYAPAQENPYTLLYGALSALLPGFQAV